MTKKSRAIPKQELQARENIHFAWKEVRKTYKYMMKWYLFYQPKSNSDKIWHLINIIIVDVILLRLFGLI